MYTKEEKASYKVSRDRLLSELYTTLTVNIGDPGDMLTGNAFKIISSDQARTIICGYINEEHREEFSIILLNLCATVRIINSQKRLVNVDKLRQMTLDAYTLLVTHFS